MGTNGNGNIEMIITLKADGLINVSGPLENKIFCLGLLEMAKDAIYKYRPSGITAVPADLLKHLGPNGKA